VEEEVPHEEGVHTYLSVKFPIYNDTGKISAVCGISTDITQIRKAQDQLRRLSDRIIESQEKERKAVSLELHDELGQVLTALRMDAVWLRDELESSEGEGKVRAQMMCDLIDKAIDEVRSMAMRLRPGVLDDLGLIDALDWLTTEFDRRTGVECLFSPGEVPAVPDALATAAYRIAQEAMTNVSRHSGAERVEVSLNSENGTLILSVIDNGRGFDDREMAEAEGLGIAGMRERASLVGGLLEVRSRPGEGASIFFNAPL
jgi:signal transduction histidine kinase